MRDYESKLVGAIRAKTKTLAGHTLGHDKYAGSLFVKTNTGVFMFCSPLWDGAESGIFINMGDDGANNEEQLNLPFVPTFNIDKDAGTYIKIMEDFLMTRGF